MSMGKSPTDTLRMIRGDLAQDYRIKRATWGISEPAPYLVPVLSVAIETDKQPSIFPEDDEFVHAPKWSLDVWFKNLGDKMLSPGSEFAIPRCFDEFTGVIYTTFFYVEHEGTKGNLIKIVGRDGEFLELLIEGQISDVHASMPPTRIVGEARFSRLSPHPEIDAQFCRDSLPPHEPPYGAMYAPPPGE
jgi:hypothetical protein